MRSLTAMYRKYYHLGQFTKTLIFGNQAVILKTDTVSHLSKRWAGHSKWQNIKSTKEHFDSIKSQKFAKFSRLIGMAVRKGGDDPNINNELKSLMEEAQKINMPKTTIQKAIAAVKNQGQEKRYWTVFTGPKGLVLGFEVTFTNTNIGFLMSKFSKARHLNLKLQRHHENVCSEKGIIVAEPLEKSEKSFDKALDDAIETGANEVFQADDGSLIFECPPERTESLSDQLSKKGYNILSATTELEFNNTVNLSESEIQEIESFISKTQNLNAEVLRASYNLAEQ